MNETSIVQYITQTFPGVETTEDFGYKFFFYGADRMLPFATLATADYDYDRFSNLDRPGVFRLNIGVSRQTFASLFGTAAIDPTDYDFSTLDSIMPHPEYAKQNWICVLSPSESTFERVRLLLAEAHEMAVKRHDRRSKGE